MEIYRMGRRRWMVCLTVSLWQYGAIGTAVADEEQPHLPVPRYVSMRHGDINLRVGPGTRYPVAWIFTKQNLPVEIVQEFENWRKIRDVDGTEGWVTAAALQGRRFVLVTQSMRALLSAPSDGSPVVARAEPGVIGKLKKCPAEAPEWCEVELGGTTGWLRRTEIWGVLPQEIYPTS